jgi:hypothetical protein
MGNVEITTVNGDASPLTDPNASALEQARAMERHFNAMDMELKKAGLGAQSLKVTPISITSPTLLSPSGARASSPTNAVGHTPPSASSVGPPASATSPTPKAGSKLEAIFGGKRKLSDGTNADKSKKKKRLDDIMFGLGASKGLALGTLCLRAVLSKGTRPSISDCDESLQALLKRMWVKRHKSRPRMQDVLTAVKQLRDQICGYDNPEDGENDDPYSDDSDCH